jgi:hypothetical protein
MIIRLDDSMVPFLSETEGLIRVERLVWLERETSGSFHFVAKTKGQGLIKAAVSLVSIWSFLDLAPGLGFIYNA